MRRLLLASTALSLIAPSLSFAAEDGATMLGPLMVESESGETLQQDGYVAIQGQQATKVDAPIARIPQAVSTVTQAQMEDQKPRTLNEAISYSAGVDTGTFGFDTRYDAFKLRGFPAHYTGMFRDGLRQYNGPSAWFRNDPYTVEGIAILKGPASSLYGVSGPGGLVNLVTKRPKDQPFHEIELLGGTDDRRQAAFDLSGPVDDEGRVLYRLTGLARASDTTLDGYPDDKTLIAPAATIRFDEDTQLTLLGEYADATVGGTAVFYNPSYGVASHRYAGDPDYNDFDQIQWRAGYEFSHRVDDVLTLEQKLRYTDVSSDLEYRSYQVGGLAFPYWGHYREAMDAVTVDTLAKMVFDTGRVTHELVTGFDYTRASYDAWSAGSTVSSAAAAAARLGYGGGQETDQYGLYLHDQMVFGGWTVFASGRYDRVDTRVVAADRSSSDQDDQAFSGRLGVSYAFENGLTPYANVSSSFSPNIGLVYDDPYTGTGRAAEPTRALQKEIGVKYQIPGTNSLLSAALFDIDQEDGVVFDATTGVNRQRQLDMNSRGIELEAVVSLDDGWSLVAAYTHQRVKIEKGIVGAEGKELSATPNDIASLWVHYDIAGGALDGLGLGAGLRYFGKSWGDDVNSFKNDDRAFLDAAISYNLASLGQPGAEIQLNARNLFDSDDQSCSAGYCYRDEGRVVTTSLRYRF
ncbi:TonB-dependent siderophore receptor [Tistrella mobilis]|uniref:TonB-dependent siderophore receptor n=1 Tax=Tistrella mobilis (strain KA081020-065) TaxID=1110502 RepID=I3THM5_TISMK|nr:TonB-dependent siderophore receptor [Tistrella mobilis]AFK52263.1 TonB-dependent siderophore receptor [Tistrella mobilis KA081020-065]